MQLMDPARRMSPGDGEELSFRDAGEEVQKRLSATAGRALLLSDGTSAEVFAAGARSPRTVCAVFDGDVLPLFLMPDGVSRVLAAGEAPTLRAARYFAEVRGIPCTLFPSDAALDGVFCREGEVTLGGRPVRVPLKAGELVCDRTLLSPYAGAYARLLLAVLADIEARALAAFGRSAAPPAGMGDLPQDEEGVVRANAVRRRKEMEGAPEGEGVVLARKLGEKGEELPEWGAFFRLSALYAAFFERGKPRRYFTPDYGARAARAGTTHAAVPSAEEYARMALALERMRAGLIAELRALLAERERYRSQIAKFYGKKPPETKGLSLLSRLPEYAPHGLSAVIRDFGLMEFDDDERTVAP